MGAGADAVGLADGLGDGPTVALGEADTEADGALGEADTEAGGALGGAGEDAGGGLADGTGTGPVATYAARSAPPTTMPASSPRRIASRGPTTAQCTSTNRPPASGPVLT